jgi:hypothetical protein
MDFKKLKSLRGKQSLARLNEEVAKVQETGRKADDRFWSPTVDKSGNGYSIIRFLPAPPNEDLPFIRLFDHGFKGPSGLWYIENSLTTLGQSDPVSEYNSKLWNSTADDNSPARKQAREQKRRLHFISNIYVISDPANPDTEGKVYLYKFGKKIFNKISEKLEPEFVDEEAFNPFDLWEGANFKLKIRHVDGYRNYDRSEFEKNGALFDDDEKLEKIWKSQHGLKEFIDPSNFKTYDELKEKLSKVLSESLTNKVERDLDSLSLKDEMSFISKGKTLEPMTFSSLNADDDEDLEFFQKLAG